MQPRRWGASEIFRRRRKVSERDMPNCNPLLPMLSVEILCVTNGGNFVFTFLCGMTLPGSVMNNIAKDIAEKGSAGVFYVDIHRVL